MVSTTNLTSGRIRQKLRTRRDILDAARRILERGGKPRMAEVAGEADVSRATVYRYFPNEELLLIEATLEGLVPDFAPVLDKSGEDPVDRAVGLTRAYYDFTAGNEPAFRRYLRAVLEAALDEDGTLQIPRAGRRPEAFAAALETSRPRLEKRVYDNLRFVLSALTGIEALIVMKDVCGVSEKRGREALAWAARTLVEAAIEKR